MSANRDALESLRSEVNDVESVIDSAVVLITGLVNRITAALMGNDLSADITSLRDELDAAQHKLSTAVAENTQAAEDSDTTYDPAPIGDDTGAGDADGSMGESSGDTGSTDSSNEGQADGGESETVQEGSDPVLDDSAGEEDSASGSESADDNGDTVA